MSAPYIKSQSPMTVSFGATMTIQTGGASPGDLVVIYVEGVSWFSINDGSPGLPAGFRVLYSAQAVTGFKVLAWLKVPAGGMSSVVLRASPGMDVTGGWWGYATVFSNVGYTQPGWVDIPGSAGDYVTYTRSDIATPATHIGVRIRLEFDALGVTQWFFGWANGDLGFGLNASNRPIFYINNTSGAPIGNVAANADIPGLAANQKVWLQAQVELATGEVEYWYSFTEIPRGWDPLNNHLIPLGTVVTGTGAGTTPRVTNSDTVFIGARDAATTPFNGQVYLFQEWKPGLFLAGQDFSDDLAGGYALVGGDVIHYQPTGEDFPSFPFDDWWFCEGICYADNTAPSIPPRHVGGPDRLAYHEFRGGKFGGPHANDPIVGPSDWLATNDRATNALGFYLKNVTRYREVDATWVSAVASSGGQYGWNYHTLVIQGRTDPAAPPASPQPPLLRLGCAETYTAFITANDYETIIDEVKWTRLNWGRVLDDISAASGTFPDELGGVNCLAKRGGLLPWKHGLLLERNDQEVWRGPITNVQRQGDSIVVNAADVLSRYRRRLAIRDALVTYSQADCGLVFHDVLTIHAALEQDSWSLPVPLINTNVPLDRVLKPKELKYAWDFLNELLNTALDAFVANGQLFLHEPGVGWVYQAVIKRTFPGVYNVNHDLIYGMFTEQSWETRPDWAIDGMSQGNFVASPSADSGEYGFRTFAIAEVPNSIAQFGVLDYVDVDPLEVPADQQAAQTAGALQARANSLAALRGFAPAVITGGTLSQEAPIDVNNLVPGAIWLMDIFDAGYGQLLVASRVKRIEVNVSKAADGTISETITPTLEPPGWTEDSNG